MLYTVGFCSAETDSRIHNASKLYEIFNAQSSHNGKYSSSLGPFLMEELDWFHTDNTMLLEKQIYVLKCY